MKLTNRSPIGAPALREDPRLNHLRQFIEVQRNSGEETEGDRGIGDKGYRGDDPSRARLVRGDPQEQPVRP